MGWTKALGLVSGNYLDKRIGLLRDQQVLAEIGLISIASRMQGFNVGPSMDYTLLLIANVSTPVPKFAISVGQLTVSTYL